MAIEEELKKIKKAYGEKFMKMCRELFPTLLEDEGKLYEILNMTFSSNSQTLYEDITSNGLEEEFKNYIYSKIDVEDEGKPIVLNKTPYELLEKAGYDLYECTTEEEIQKFKKYYANGEELCTFHGGRLNSCVVFFAVTKDVENIKREDYPQPKREDKYGTSVMGIQFNRQGMTSVSIKNRYNHKVNNPDATYGNDLNRIAEGLEESFGRLLEKRGLYLNSTNKEKFEIPKYTVINGKYYKYNIEINGIYYCPGNIIIQNGRVHTLDKNEELIDYFIVDSKSKEVRLYDDSVPDSFTEDLQDLDKIEIRKDKEKGEGRRQILLHKKGEEQPVIIGINSNNQIIEYQNESLRQVGNDFLRNNKALREFNAPKLESAGKGFLEYNIVLSNINLPNLRYVGDKFLSWNNALREFNAPKLEIAGCEFLEYNEVLSNINIPNLRYVEGEFLSWNKALKEFDAPKLEVVGRYFLIQNKDIEKINIPNLRQVEEWFLVNNKALKKFNAPNLEIVGESFLEYNEDISDINIPSLRYVKDAFLANNKALKEFNAPKLAMSEDKRRLLRIVEENTKKRKTITPKDIGNLDKDNELTTTEISQASREIENIQENNREER